MTGVHISQLRAPFPWFGGKRPVAEVVWSRFGNPDNYVEPFAGSAAMLLARPDEHAWWSRTETINDADGFVANFWRAVQAEPEAVARWADWPVNENDLHARHAWLVTHGTSLVERLEGDPEFYDARVAGWWVWGLCLWIGGGWCSGDGPWRQVDGKLVHGKLVHLGGDGRGINRKRVHLGDGGRGINRKLVHLGDDGRGHCEAWSQHLRDMMTRLRDRFRRVRVCSGDWTRVVGPTPTTKLGTTAVFLDPPYAADLRDSRLYRREMTIADEVRAWAVEHGDDPAMRIALCGYAGEHEMPEGWTCYRWSAQGGYSLLSRNPSDNRHLETIWFSPNCLQPEVVTQQSLPLALEEE